LGVTTDEAGQPRPDLRTRLALALFAGILAGVLAGYTEIVTGPPGSDYRVVWTAARSVLHGIDPYGVTGSAVPPLGDRFFYPLPAWLFGMPFVWLPVSLAAVCFAAASGAFFMFAITRDGFERVPVVLSIPFIIANKISQTTPLVTALALTPALAGLALLKPNLGLAFFARAPKLLPVVVCAILLVAAWIAFPDWPAHWLATVRSSSVHEAPLRTSLGAVGLAALLRWRRPEARLLVVMTIVPHGLAFYDELPLWLVANTRREAMLLTMASWLAALAWLTFGDGRFMHSAPWSTGFLYVPAAGMVLMRKNEGSTPAWIEKWASSLPAFARGSISESP
jgi:hypothetical protein